MKTISEALIEFEQLLSKTDPRELMLKKYDFIRSTEDLVTKHVSSVQHEVWARDEKERQRKALSRGNAELRAIVWADNNLTVGQFIKVVGARDGAGIRRVLNVNRLSKTVECKQIGVKAYFYQGQPVIEEMPYITTHFFGKVRGTVQLEDTGRPTNPLFTDKAKGPIRTKGEWKISDSALK